MWTKLRPVPHAFGTATNHVKSRNAALNMKGLNIAMSVDNIPVKNINILMNMIPLLPTGDEREI